MNDFFFSVDNELKLRSWAKEVERRSGKSAAEIRGMPYYKVFRRLKTGDDKDAVAKVIEEGMPRKLKGCRIFGSDRTNGKEVLITPIKSEQDKTVGAKVRVAFCGPLVPSEKLRQPQLVDYKVASSLAHGIRSPLNSIKGAVVYLKEKYASDKTFLEFSKIIEEEILRLDSFITGFLSNMAFPDVELARTDINMLLREVEILASFQADASNIETHYAYGEVPPVMVDSFQLKHAVLNIVNNALEAMHKGGRLSVKTLREIRDGRPQVVIEISDTGPGMSPLRTDEWGKSSDHRGRGYGVSITREIIQSHGGSMEIKSRKGRGTTVRLYIPVSDPEGAYEG